MSSSRVRNLAKLSLLLVATAVVCFVLGEIGSRIYLRLTTGHSVTPELSRSVGEYDPEIGVRLLRDVEAEFTGSEFETRFSTNANALREAEPTPYQRRPGKTRILLAGDSFTFGHGVNDEDRYGERLEELLPDTEVINMGIWGTGTDQQYLLYLREGRKYRPDLVVLGYFVENIIRNATTMRFITEGRVAHKPRFVLDERGDLQLTNVPVPRPGESPERAATERERWDDIVERQGTGIPIPFKSFLREHSAFYKLLHARLSGLAHRMLRSAEEPYPEYDENREEWRVTRAIFSAFADSVRADGSRFLLMIIPAKEYVLREHVADKPNRMIRAYCEANSIPVLDLLPAFRSAPPRERETLYFRMDAHWSPAGHRLAARALADHLRESGYK